jgi:mRNA-degrading endonuclease RelE of RelBE toxin-antitoxin system
MPRVEIPTMAFRIEYDPATEAHLAVLTAREVAMVLDTVPLQLAHKPVEVTRNRKPLRPNLLAPWELRIGDLRVYYDVQVEPEPVVTIRAVGVKDRNRVRIAGKEFAL